MSTLSHYLKLSFFPKVSAMGNGQKAAHSFEITVRSTNKPGVTVAVTATWNTTEISSSCRLRVSRVSRITAARHSRFPAIVVFSLISLTVSQPKCVFNHHSHPHSPNMFLKTQVQPAQHSGGTFPVP